MQKIDVSILVEDADECSLECWWLGSTDYCGFPIPQCNLFSKDLYKGFSKGSVSRCDMCKDISFRMEDNENK